MAYRATLKDVAAAAGVSVTTVSLVLNNRPARVSEEKRKAIADAAKKLNYVPNQSARSLVTKQKCKNLFHDMFPPIKFYREQCWHCLDAFILPVICTKEQGTNLRFFVFD